MFIWKCNSANRFSVRGRFRVRVGLGDRKYRLVNIKVIEVYGKSPQFTETNVCVMVCVATRHNKAAVKLENVVVVCSINHSPKAHGWNISGVIFVHIWAVRSDFASTNTLSHTQIQLNLTQQWIINKPAAKLTCHINQFLFTNRITWHEKAEALKHYWNISSLSYREAMGNAKDQQI